MVVRVTPPHGIPGTAVLVLHFYHLDRYTAFHASFPLLAVAIATHTRILDIEYEPRTKQDQCVAGHGGLSPESCIVVQGVMSASR